MNQVAAVQISPTSRALTCLQEVYRDAHQGLIQGTKESPSALSERLTAARVRYLEALFDRHFGALHEEHHICLGVAGGTANNTTSRFSDVDVFLVMPASCDSDPKCCHAREGFRNELTAAGLHFDLLVHDSSIAIDFESIRRIPNPPKRETAERRALETFFSHLSARWVAGDSPTFEHFRESVALNVTTSPEYMLSKWCSTIRHRWTSHTEYLEAGTFDLKNGRGGLRDLDALDQLTAILELHQRARDILSVDDRATIQVLRNRLLAFKHALHFNSMGDKTPPNPEDRKFTEFTLAKARAITRKFPSFLLTAHDGAEDDKIALLLGSVSEARRELFAIATKALARVSAFYEKRPLLVPELAQEPLSLAYAALRKSLPERPDESAKTGRIVEASLRVFGALREKYSGTHWANILQNLSPFDHEIVTDLKKIAATISGDSIFKNHPEAALEFRNLLNGPRDIAQVFELLYHTGWLQLLIPEFDRAQRLYSPKNPKSSSQGAHAIECLGVLDRVLAGNAIPASEHEELFGGFANLSVQYVEVLRLALLCHDLGHGNKEGDLSLVEAGAVTGHRVAQQLEFSDTNAWRAYRLIERHRYLPRIAGSFHGTSDQLAKRVSENALDPDFLNMLFLISAAIQTSYVQSASSELLRLINVFVCGREGMRVHKNRNCGNVNEAIPIVVERIKRDPELIKLFLGDIEASVRGHFGALTEEYLGQLTLEEIAYHVAGVAYVRRNKAPFIHWMQEATKGEQAELSATRAQRLIVVAPDAPGLLSQLCGSIPSSASVGSAKVFTRTDGIACDIVTCDVPVSFSHYELNQRYRTNVGAGIISESPFAERILDERKKKLAEPFPAPLVYSVSSVRAEKSTTIEIRGPDRRQLACLITYLMRVAGIPQIVSAVLGSDTDGGVIDSFLVSGSVDDATLRELALTIGANAALLASS